MNNLIVVCRYTFISKHAENAVCYYTRSDIIELNQERFECLKVFSFIIAQLQLISRNSSSTKRISFFAYVFSLN